jgi:hypothetical protein
MAERSEIETAIGSYRRALEWSAEIALDPRMSPLAIRLASALATIFAAENGIRIDVCAIVDRFKVNDREACRARAELIAFGYLDAGVVEDGIHHWLAFPTGEPAPAFEETDQDFKTHARRRALLKRKWLEMLPGASDAELLLLGVEAINSGEAGLFDLAAILGAPATVIVGDFERIAGRKATASDWNGSAF